MIEICPICEGSGLEVVRQEGRQFVRDCACRVQRRAARMLERAHIPRRYENCLLDNYDIHFPSSNITLEAAHLQATNFVKSYPVGIDGTGLLLTGSIGV